MMSERDENKAFGYNIGDEQINKESSQTDL
jgi:hypothetical protein